MGRAILVIKKRAIGSRKIEYRMYKGTSGTNKKNKSGKKMTKNEVFAAESSNFAEKIDCQFTAADIVHNKLVLSSFTLFATNTSMDMSLTGYKLSG